MEHCRDPLTIEDTKRTGDEIYMKLQSEYPYLAGKITGMLMEMNQDEVNLIITNPEHRARKVKESLDVLFNSSEMDAELSAEQRQELHNYVAARDNAKAFHDGMTSNYSESLSWSQSVLDNDEILKENQGLLQALDKEIQQKEQYPKPNQKQNRNRGYPNSYHPNQNGKMHVNHHHHQQDVFFRMQNQQNNFGFGSNNIKNQTYYPRAQSLNLYQNRQKYFSSHSESAPTLSLQNFLQNNGITPSPQHQNHLGILGVPPSPHYLDKPRGSYQTGNVVTANQNFRGPAPKHAAAVGQQKGPPPPIALDDNSVNFASYTQEIVFNLYQRDKLLQEKQKQIYDTQKAVPTESCIRNMTFEGVKKLLVELHKATTIAEEILNNKNYMTCEGCGCGCRKRTEINRSFKVCEGCFKEQESNNRNAKVN